MTGIQQAGQIANSSQVMSMGIVSADHLTAEGLMIYLQTKLDGIDEQIQEAFEKQQLAEEVRGYLGEIQNQLASLDSEDGGDWQAEAVASAFQGLYDTDPKLADKLFSDLNAAGLVTPGAKGDWDPPERLDGAQFRQFKEIVDNTLKQLDSSAQLEMLQLQSLMSARQTAVQLATNMVAAIGKTDESIVSNIR